MCNCDCVACVKRFTFGVKKESFCDTIAQRGNRTGIRAVQHTRDCSRKSTRAFTHWARQRLHTHCVHGSGSALACPGVAPLPQVRSSPARSCRAARHRPAAYRRLFLHVRAGGGHAGAAASRSTVSGQPGAHRTSTRPKHNHPAAVKSLLNKWFHANYDHPFPDGRTKAELAARTGERLLPSCGASW